MDSKRKRDRTQAERKWRERVRKKERRCEERFKDVDNFLERRK